MNEDKLKCQCGCGMTVNPIFKWLLESQERHMQDYLEDREYELKLNSVARCKSHNHAVGGSLNSAHMIGQAVDTPFNDMREANGLLEWLYMVGVKRIIIHWKKKFIHWDNAFGKDLPFPELTNLKTYPAYFDIKE